MLGEGGHEMPAFLGGRDAVVWARDYSQGSPIQLFVAALLNGGPKASLSRGVI